MEKIVIVVESGGRKLNQPNQQICPSKTHIFFNLNDFHFPSYLDYYSL